jgi:hypothetical protein
MSIDTALTEIMIDTITVASVTAKTAYGVRTWGTATTISNCRVQTGSHKVLDSEGTEKVASGKVYVPGSPTITINDKLTLPNGSQPPIIKVVSVNDQSGANHMVIHYGE